MSKDSYTVTLSEYIVVYLSKSSTLLLDALISAPTDITSPDTTYSNKKVIGAEN
jgi:hypothetical protein